MEGIINLLDLLKGGKVLSVEYPTEVFRYGNLHEIGENDREISTYAPSIVIEKDGKLIEIQFEIVQYQARDVE